MLIRSYQDADEVAVLGLWREVLPDAVPHNDPATAIWKKLVVGDGLFVVAELDPGTEAETVEEASAGQAVPQAGGRRGEEVSSGREPSRIRADRRATLKRGLLLSPSHRARAQTV
jgi:hypothetical protein